MGYIETETKVLAKFKTLPTAYKQAFCWAFALINLAFLFHTVNFMFGDHDWNYVRTANYWSEGAFEGRPLHFVLQSVFFGGEVLPILNNLLSFAAMALSGILLAKYWQIPLSTFNYALFATFVAVLPYTLVWLFYAKDTLINLTLPLICVCGLLLADYAVKEKKPLYHLLAVILFYFAFASYAAVINLLGVCFLGGIIFAYIYSNDNICTLIRQSLLTAIDMLTALIIFKVTLALMPMDMGYNTQTITLEYLPEKIIETITVMFKQFIVPLPFMEYKFKLILLLLTLIGVGGILLRGGKEKIFPLAVIMLAMLFSSKLAYFIADERGQILAEMENFAYVPRLDFYGLVYIYALGLAGVLALPAGKWQKAGVLLAVVIAFMSLVRDMYAEKVWKLGFDAEMKAHERIITRLEERADFNPSRHYRLLQIGSLSLRQNFYLKQKGEEISLDLLSTSFTPQFMSRIVYNFYYPRDIFYNNAVVDELSLRGKEWLLYQAAPFPHKDSIYIDGDIVIIVLTKEGLTEALRR